VEESGGVENAFSYRWTELTVFLEKHFHVLIHEIRGEEY